MHSGTLARLVFARCSALQEVFFVVPSSLCSALQGIFFVVLVPQKVVFHDLHHYMFIDPFVHAHVNAISDPHTHTLTHTLMKHTMHHTLHTHTNSHDICNCTACIHNRHRQAHIDHDIQSTFHILPHIHNMCTQLITPCERYNLQCCVSKHITTICVQPHHCCMHVAQAQLCSFVLVCQLLQVNLSTFITCCVADVYWQYCVC